jgi:hypothetical protein
MLPPLRTVLLAVLPAAALAADHLPVDFARDIQPILSENCFHCHGFDPETREAGLRLDTREGATRDNEGVRAVVPGKPEESELMARIVSHDPDEVMPPPKSKKKISEREAGLLRRWIAEGAEYKGHWAFEAPRRPAVPAAAGASHPVDAFVRARLAQEKLAPSPEADRATILRRLSLDLIGLPPSPQEIAAFESDAAPDAFEKQVERLLASPHYGERWARWWMDAARYADSDGFEKDLPRQQWPWRDWVIRSLNADKPYDQFIIEQIAGDLLPDATQDQRVATGFLRNGMVNEEGAILAEQFRMEGVIDRLDCIGKSVLGLTLNCVQCHDHKFDPIAQREYFQLFAFLNNDYEAIQRVFSPGQEKEKARIAKETAAKVKELKDASPEWQSWLAAWEDEQRAKEPQGAWTPLKPHEAEVIGGLSHPDIMPDASVLTLGFRLNDGTLYVVADTQEKSVTGLRLDALTHGDLPFNGPGRSFKGSFAISELVVEAAPLSDPGKYTRVELKSATANARQKEALLEPFFRRDENDRRIVGGADLLIDGLDETAWGADRGPRLRNNDSHAVVQFAKPLAIEGGARLKISLKFKHGGKSAHGNQSNLLGRFRLSTTGDENPRADSLPSEVRAAVAKAPEGRSADEQAAVFEHWRWFVAGWKKANDEMDKLWAQWPEGDHVLALADRRPEHRRTTHILQRGDWQKPGDAVQPGVPGILHPLPEGAPANRLTLARWLVDRRSPTTARVLVNRVWQAYFGTGFVESPEDFGTRAGLPSHPGLLDWLAVETQENGWSLKKLHRLIVTSATYRQRSTITPELAQRDPQNKLLARGPRFRPDAEMVRDIALAASGLLDRKRLGGPSIFPPVPESLFALSFLDVDFWKTATGPERYSRSLYVFRRRSMPDPVLANFDAPTGDFSCTRRVRSNTPLAALATLNETVFTEAAQALALRILREGGATDTERLAYGIRLCTGRSPRPAENETMLALLASGRERLGKGELRAAEIAFSDFTKPSDLPPNATPNDAAAWTLVARVLLNLDATLTKS